MSCFKCDSEKVFKPMDDVVLTLSICEKCMKNTTQKEFNDIWNKLEKEREENQEGEST